jgi:outer membrane receptor protein involved in Fe transport
VKSLSPWARVFALVLFALLLASGAAWAQEATGKIVGTVTDPKGGVIPDAKVTATNTATRDPHETTTNREGFFQILSLPIGTYRVSVEHPGFRKLVSDPKTLEINQTLRFDLQLELGSPSEVVEVTAQVAGVETVNPTLGESVTLARVANMPLNGRNVYDLALLMPGVTEVNPTTLTANSPGQFSVAGGRTDSVTFLLDGGVNNNLLSNLVVYTPNPDAIQEFRILTSNYTAEYGRNAGGVVSVVTKSGTNAFHGSLFEFLRNDALNANSFFRNEAGLPKEILKRNQFGGTVGGPITIPKVAHGKDRMFFFFGYQGQRLVAQQTNPKVTVFTPAELQGDFSLSNLARTGPDPGVAAFLQAHPFFQPNPALAARAIMDPTKIDPVAQKYLSNNLLPSSPTGVVVPTGSANDNRDEFTGKADFIITSKDRLAVTLGVFRRSQLIPFTAESNAAGYPDTTVNHNKFANLAYTRTFSPNILNEFRFTAQRSNNNQFVPARTLPKPNDLGIGITSDHPTGPSQLSFIASGLTLGFSRNGPTNLIDNTFVFSDTFSWVRGRHSWKFGFTASPYQNNTVFDFFINGRFFFRGPTGSGGIGSGKDLADFLLGLPDEYSQFPEAPSNIRTRSYYAFAQDEWHMFRNFTLTLGIRYEYSSPKFDTQGRSFSLKLGQQSVVFTKAPLGLLFPGDPGAPKGANFPDRNDWAPRIGFAWDPWGKGKTSIRGGFGVFYDILKGEDNLQFNGQAPFFGFADLFFRALAGNPSAPLNYISQPFVATNSPNPFPSRPPPSNLDFGAAGFLPIGGSGVFFVDPHLRTPYIYQYNLSLQQAVTTNLTVEANYVGSSSHKLTDLVDANPFVLGTQHRLFNTQPGTTDSSYSFMDDFRNVANAHYNSLELSATKRVSASRFFGTSFFTFAYTYGHSIDNASGFRERNASVPFYNAKQFVASSDYDVRHRISFSAGWDLPFDRAWSSGPKRLTQGWGVYPIVTYRTGFPVDVTGGFSRARTRPGPSGAGDGQLVRANLTGSSITFFDPRQSQTIGGNTGNFWFDPTNFTTSGIGNGTNACTPCATNPALRTYGTFPRNGLRGPSQSNVNLAIAKQTPLFGERLNLLFRAEFFNLFNHAQFQIPNTNINNRALFGQITSVIPDSQRIVQLALKLAF